MSSVLSLEPVIDIHLQRGSIDMIPTLVACATSFEHAMLEFFHNHSDSGIMVALGSASFIIGTVLRRTQRARKELTDAEPYTKWNIKMPADSTRGAISSAGDSRVSRSNANAA